MSWCGLQGLRLPLRVHHHLDFNRCPEAGVQGGVDTGMDMDIDMWIVEMQARSTHEQTQVINTGSKDFSFTAGLHTYFQVHAPTHAHEQIPMNTRAR